MGDESPGGDSADPLQRFRNRSSAEGVRASSGAAHGTRDAGSEHHGQARHSVSWMEQMKQLGTSGPADTAPRGRESEKRPGGSPEPSPAIPPETVSEVSRRRAEDFKSLASKKYGAIAASGPRTYYKRRSEMLPGRPLSLQVPRERAGSGEADSSAGSAHDGLLPIDAPTPEAGGPTNAGGKACADDNTGTAAATVGESPASPLPDVAIGPADVSQKREPAKDAAASPGPPPSVLRKSAAFYGGRFAADSGATIWARVSPPLFCFRHGASR